MKNKKGFVMTETLVVTVFLVTIFTFIYVSIIPLFGKYEDVTERETDIDIVYKLYHIRKMLYSDPNKSSIITMATNPTTSLPYESKELTCDNFTDVTYCNTLMNFLELPNNSYKLVYIHDIFDSIERNEIKKINTDLEKYLKRYEQDEGTYLAIIDLNHHTVAHLYYDNEDI